MGNDRAVPNAVSTIPIRTGAKACRSLDSLRSLGMTADADEPARSAARDDARRRRSAADVAWARARLRARSRTADGPSAVGGRSGAGRGDRRHAAPDDAIVARRPRGWRGGGDQPPAH